MPHRCVFAVLQSAYQPIDASSCYPEPTPHAVEEYGPPSTILAAATVLAIAVSAVVLKAHLAKRGEPSQASLSREPPCARRWTAHSWVIILGTFGILLGYSLPTRTNRSQPT